MAEPRKRKPGTRVHRRCPACGAARRSADFPRVAGRLVRTGIRWSRCPDRGHEAPTVTFPRLAPDVPRERGGERR